MNALELNEKIMDALEDFLKNTDNVKKVFARCFCGHGWIALDTTGLYHVENLSDIRDDAYKCTKADWDWAEFAGDYFLSENPDISKTDALADMEKDVDYLAALKYQILECFRKIELVDYRGDEDER